MLPDRKNVQEERTLTSHTTDCNQSHETTTTTHPTIRRDGAKKLPDQQPALSERLRPNSKVKSPSSITATTQDHPIPTPTPTQTQTPTLTTWLPMLEQQQVNPENIEELNIKLRIMQINLNKSEKAHLDIINEKVSRHYDLMLIQEPYAMTFNHIRTPTNFRPIFPSNRIANAAQIRLVIWVNKNLEIKNWKIIDMQNTNDITAIQLKGAYRKITIFNIYNDCTHSRNEATLQNYLTSHRNEITDGDGTHMIWAGDFNRHHPFWDDDKDTRLFTNQALRAAEGIINLIAQYNMDMALPKGIPTLQHMRSKNYSRPDNIFLHSHTNPTRHKMRSQSTIQTNIYRPLSNSNSH